MKSNETPEKIYLERILCSNEVYDNWKSQKTISDDIEYTRTDTFIEKVENFLEMLGYGFTITDNITHADYDKEQLIEDFKNYMKEE